MENPKTDNSLGTGVYYAEDDYIGIGKRLLILLIDACVLAVAVWITDVLWYSLPPNNTTYMLLSWGMPLFAYLYLTVIKASKDRTLGYRLLGAKVLTFRGERPSIFRMTFRLLLWVAGPLNLVMDLVWVGIDQDRQSIRDRFAGTCLVKVNAVAIGEGPIHLSYFQAFGLSLMLPTVCRPKTTKCVTE